MFYSDTATRMKVIASIDEKMEKISSIPGDVMSYTEVRELRNYLELLRGAIMKEDKEEKMRAKFTRRAVG